MAKGFNKFSRTPRIKTKQPPKSYAKKFLNSHMKLISLPRRLTRSRVRV